MCPCRIITFTDAKLAEALAAVLGHEASNAEVAAFYRFIDGRLETALDREVEAFSQAICSQAISRIPVLAEANQ